MPAIRITAHPAGAAGPLRRAIAAAALADGPALAGRHAHPGAVPVAGVTLLLAGVYAVEAVLEDRRGLAVACLRTRSAADGREGARDLDLGDAWDAALDGRWSAVLERVVEAALADLRAAGRGAADIEATVHPPSALAA